MDAKDTTDGSDAPPEPRRPAGPRTGTRHRRPRTGVRLRVARILPNTGVEFVEMPVDEPRFEVLDVPGFTTPALTAALEPSAGPPLARSPFAPPPAPRPAPDRAASAGPEAAPRRAERPLWLGPVLAIAAIAAIAYLTL